MTSLLRFAPLLLGLASLALLEFTSIISWLEIQSTAIVITGLAILSTVVVVLSKNVADYADEVSEVIGQPIGTLVLTGSVISIELALVASTMLKGEANPTLARDSMFSVLMIALTGVTGICNIIVAIRQGRMALEDDGLIDADELATTNLVGSNTYFLMISTMSVLALIIPNFSPTTSEANFSTPVNVVLSIVAVGVYAIFLTAQMSSYSTLFSEVMPDLIRPQEAASGEGPLQEIVQSEETTETAPSLQASALMLMAGLLVVVLISESMGHLIETGITDLGLPSSLAGALVALLILAPEALNSIQASISGEMQRSINTLYGSVLATVSLTVPAVLAIGEITHTRVILGLDPFSSVLLVLTLFLLRPMPRLTGIEGLMRLVVFGFWLLLQVF